MANPVVQLLCIPFNPFLLALRSSNRFSDDFADSLQVSSKKKGIALVDLILRLLKSS